MKIYNRYVRSQGFTLIELLVVISIISLLISILLPALGSARKSARFMASNTHQRGVTQGFIVQGNDNDGWWPGQEPGNVKTPNFSNGGPSSATWNWADGETPFLRFALLLKADVIPADYLISPAENEDDIELYEGDGSQGSFHDNHYSYAVQMTQFTNTDQSHRLYWPGATLRSELLNSNQPVMADRLTRANGWSPNGGAHETYMTVLSSKAGNFQAGMAWGDGHVSSLNEPFVDAQFGSMQITFDDIYAHGINAGATRPGFTGNWGGTTAMIGRHKHNAGNKIKPAF